MLGEADLVAFVATTDLARARAFYGDTLGLPMLEQTPYACVFRAPNAVLRVTLVERPTRAPYTVLGWQVNDLAATAGRLAERGVQLLRYDGLEQDEPGVWGAPGGALVAWFRDPDDNVLSLTEL